jgi:hypothetical protein
MPIDLLIALLKTELLSWLIECLFYSLSSLIVISKSYLALILAEASSFLRTIEVFVCIVLLNEHGLSPISADG